MSIAVTKEENHVLVQVKAEKLDALVSPELKSELVKVTSEGYKDVVLDMSDTRYCDSSGLSAILVGNRLCKGANGFLVISGIQEAVAKLLTISQLDGVLSVVPTVKEAVDYLMMEQLERDLDED